MADVYVNTEIAAGKKANSAENAGVLSWDFVGSFETVSGDADGDVKRIIKSIPWNAILTKLEFYCDAITGGTDYDIGFYKTNGGAVIDKDALADGLDFSSAIARTGFLDGLKTVDLADIAKPIYLLAGDTLSDHELGYDIAITMNTAGSGAATIAWNGTSIQG